ncbi:MAG: diaminopimelate decarboxylase [Ktedonobacteraceae bacterium]|nr:diaminopimelate decarboxylase [Ktedonobacteraceae bacterium]
MSVLPPSRMARLLPASAAVSPSGVLHIAGHAVPDLTRQYGTPLYIFDRATIVNACQAYLRAFQTEYHASEARIIYAAKAYLSPLVAQVVAEQGLGLDVVSGGELAVARIARFPMQRISFHGNNKTEEELRLALELGVGRIVLDNWSELERLTRLADEVGCYPRVLLRVAPEVETDTHRYLQTGHASAKFGFPLSNGEARAALLRILHDERLSLAGLHAHSGTMLRETRPYEVCLERLLTLAGDVYDETGWWPEEISPGGGWAVETSEHADMPGVDVLARALQGRMEHAAAIRQKPAPTLVIEPGRSIIARAGIAVYQIGTRKKTPGGITYLFVDGGMGDNIRPALYGAQYTALPVERALAPGEEHVCISGRYCESGDVLIEQVTLPRMQEGDLLLLPLAGAYCLPMSSNYNLVPRPAVILVDERNVQVMERRESYNDLLRRYENI